MDEGPDHFNILMEPADWITKSRIQSFKYCRRQYLYFAIIQIPFSASFAMVRGRKFHYSSSQFYRLIDVRQKPTLEYYRSLLPQDPDVNELYDSFAAFELNRMETLLKENLDPTVFFSPVINEVSIRLPEQKMSGHIDRVWLMKPTPKTFNAVVMEIKSGGITSKTSLRREGCFYTYLISQTELKDYIGCVPEYIGAYSPKSNTYWVEKISQRSMGALFETLDDITYSQIRWGEGANEKLANNLPLTEEETHLMNEVWPKNDWADCTMCSYERLCWL